ncbi:MAG: ribbon-helix-helix protein, CopG family [Candidatus Micrarchaeota archaeon]
MEIVSISLDKKNLAELNKTQGKLGFRSRSKLIRATIDSLLNEYRALESIKGHVDAVFTITMEEHGKGEMNSLVKDFEEIVVTEIHQHHASRCLKILITCGKAEQIRELFSHLKREKKVKSVQISIL